ncbi:MAG: hypothetical protein V3R17_07220 [Hyphomicrobium sp.]
MSPSSWLMVLKRAAESGIVCTISGRGECGLATEGNARADKASVKAGAPRRLRDRPVTEN